jgi:hypothetical protein
LDEGILPLGYYSDEMVVTLDGRPYHPANLILVTLGRGLAYKSVYYLCLGYHALPSEAVKKRCGSVEGVGALTGAQAAGQLNLVAFTLPRPPCPPTLHRAQTQEAAVRCAAAQGAGDGAPAFLEARQGVRRQRRGG